MKLKNIQYLWKWIIYLNQLLKNVYSGIGFNDYDVEKYRDDIYEEDFIVDNDIKNKIVATSKDKYVAVNFAYMRGHSEGGRSSVVGYVMEYEVNINSIILDFSIFGGKYNENEVIIDVEKSKLKNINTLWKIKEKYQ